MLKIRIIVPGRTRTSFLQDGESYYMGRLRHYVQLDWAVIKPVGIKKGRPESLVVQEEGQAISRRIEEGDYLVALDRSGRQYDSEGFAGWLERLSNRAVGRVCFVIGGPLGLSEKILNRSQKVLSLSRMTLTHEMTRLLLLEQIYRAFTIIHREKYHK